MLGPGFLKKLKRGPQVVLPKDFGLLVGFTGVGNGDKVIDCGGGSGFLAIQLANVVGDSGKVFCFEKREDFFDLVKRNVEKSGVKNVELRLKDASEGFGETGVDLVCLDCGDSHLLLPQAFVALRKDGFCVGFLPNAEQLRSFVLEGEKTGFQHVYSLESIVREWLVRERGTRPANTGLTHTAFLAFLRK